MILKFKNSNLPSFSSKTKYKQLIPICFSTSQIHSVNIVQNNWSLVICKDKFYKNIWSCTLQYVHDDCILMLSTFDNNIVQTTAPVQFTNVNIHTKVLSNVCIKLIRHFELPLLCWKVYHEIPARIIKFAKKQTAL